MLADFKSYHLNSDVFYFLFVYFIGNLVILLIGDMMLNEPGDSNFRKVMSSFWKIKEDSLMSLYQWYTEKYIIFIILEIIY